MKFEGESSFFDMPYREVFGRGASMVYENMILGYRFKAIPHVPPSYTGVNISNNVSEICTDDDILNLVDMQGSGIDYLMIPCMTKAINLRTNAYWLLHDIDLQRNLWKSLRSIKASTVRCVDCGTVYKKEKLYTATCSLCNGAYALKAGKDYKRDMRSLEDFNLYSDELIDDKDVKCVIVSIDGIIMRYNSKRGYTI